MSTCSCWANRTLAAMQGAHNEDKSAGQIAGAFVEAECSSGAGKGGGGGGGDRDWS
jgi:hypothetical protein